MRYVRTIVPLLAVAIVVPSLSAQLRVQPVAERPDEIALRLMLRKLSSTGTFMQTTAHPDDEDNGLLAMMGFGRGMRAVLVSATRGEGGQNEIGPELFQALSVLRTEELLAAHRFDGAEQFFTRAVDFGYSFSIDESLSKWGREEILGDFVRHIRAIRPDVVAGFLCDGAGGGQHHQASAVLTREAFRAASDPSRFPEQIAEGLRPWQARRLFCTDLSSFAPRAQAGSRPLLRVQDVFEPLIGRRYGVLGIEARSMHKCQGTSQLLPLPGMEIVRTYRLQDATTARTDIAPRDFFDDIDTSITGLKAFVRSGPAPDDLIAALTAIDSAVAAAARAVAKDGQFAAAPPLASGLTELRRLRSRLAQIPLDDEAQFEIDFRLEQKERQFQQALVLAHGLRLEVLADDGLVTTGQALKVTVTGSNPAPEPVVVTGLTLTGVVGPSECRSEVKARGAFTCEAAVRVGDVPLSSAYWHPRNDAARYDLEPGVPFGIPFRPSPFRATLSFTMAGVPVAADRTVEYRYDDIVAGEKRMELQVVPRFAAVAAPDIAVIPTAAVSGASPGATLEIAVTVVNHERGAARGTVRLQMPAGWTAAPARAPVELSRQDESATVRFEVTPPRDARPGEYEVTALIAAADSATAASSLGYDVIEYPHIHRRHLVKPARTRLKIIDVTVAPGLQVGYVMGVGDQVPPAIEQLGATVRLIGPEELASGDLSRYDVIVTGVRAYERRPDLRANNHRLLDYAAAGGTVLVQYNKFEFNQAQYGPFPAEVGSDRVTDESAPVEILAPDHPVFTTPNRIGADAWEGWVQERGLYFLGKKDPRYVDLVRLTDPFELNPGAKTGALVEARAGKGRWLYIGLGLWRQLPAGTPGAYELLANLLSLSRDPGRSPGGR
jgi:LmbE family N-acetylglucosaminyl deacetylase